MERYIEDLIDLSV